MAPLKVHLNIMKLKAGETVPLVLQLLDGETTKYVRATVKTQAGVAVSGSPFSMAHEATGLYKSITLDMPTSVEFIQVQYRVYDDSGLTTVSTYADTTEIFYLDTNVNVQFPSLEATLSGSKLEAVIEKDET